MAMKKLKDVWDSVLNFEHRNRAAILTSIGVAGLWSTAWMAYRAGPRAEKILEEKRKDMRDILPEDKKTKRVVVMETIKELFPVIFPTVLLGGVSTVCIIGSNTISSRRIAALTTAYTVTDSALKTYKSKVSDILGEKKAQQIKEAISKERVLNNPPESEEQIIHTGNGDVLCYDEYSGRYFYSNADKIGAAVVKLSYDIADEMWISLNELYFELGLPEIKMGDEFGWRFDRLDHGLLPISYCAILTEDKKPCISVQYDVALKDHFS